MGIRVGLQLWNQVYDWPETARAAKRAEELGFDHLWSWEHLLSLHGYPHSDTFDAYTLLAAWSQITTKIRLGVLTGANTFRNPGLLAKMVTTLDHVSEGRAILGIGAAWHEPEHIAFGIEFGRGFGDRLAWLDESVAAIRALLDGETVTSPAVGHYSFKDAKLRPLPVQAHLPILVGGGGEQKTLRTVARYADMWNWKATEDLEMMQRKEKVLRQRCEEIGRDHTEIERTAFFSPVIRDTEEEAQRFFRIQMEAGRLHDVVLDQPALHLTTPEHILELMTAWKEIGFETFIIESASPFDDETVRRFAKEIRYQVDRA